MQILSAAVLGALLSVPSLAAPPKSKKPPALPGERVEFAAKDGWMLRGVFLRPLPEDQKVFVLLHMTGRRKEDWALMMKMLQDRGYGALAFDFRGHGESRVSPEGQPTDWRRFTTRKGASEWENLLSDLEGAMQYLSQQGVSESSAVLCGADVGSSIALKYAAVHPAIPMTLHFSAGMSYQEILTVNAMRRYGRRPILFVVGLDDRRSWIATKLLFDIAKLGSGAENAMKMEVEREHGTRMLTRGLIERILAWVEYPVAPPEPLPEDTTSPAENPGEEATQETSTPPTGPF